MTWHFCARSDCSWLFTELSHQQNYQEQQQTGNSKYGLQMKGDWWGGHMNSKVFPSGWDGELLELLFSFHERQGVRERTFQNRPKLTQSNLALSQGTNWCSHSLNVPKAWVINVRMRKNTRPVTLDKLWRRKSRLSAEPKRWGRSPKVGEERGNKEPQEMPSSTPLTS